MPTRILFVIGSLDRGGAEGQLVKLASNLNPHRWSAQVFCLSHPGDHAAWLMAAGIPVTAPVGANSARGKYAGKSIFSKGMRALVAVYELSRFIHGFRPEIIHLILPQAYIIGGLLTILQPVRVRVMSRRSMNLYQKKIPLSGAVERWLHKRMDACIGNARAVTDELLTEGAEKAKVRLIYNGLNLYSCPDNAQNREAKLRELALEEPVVLCVVIANLIDYKGHLDLVAAVALSKQHYNCPVRFLIIGRDDGMRASIQTRIEELGVAENFLFLGSRGNTQEWMCAADISILASHQEGFSNVILESMSCALPVIATRVGGNAEAIVDGETGILVPKQNPECLGQAIVKLVNEPALRRQYGIAGRGRAAMYFDWKRCLQEHDDLYTELLQVHPKV